MSKKIKEIVFNNIINNEIIFYLINKKSIFEIFEISLISKSFFKIVSKLLTYNNQVLNNIKPPIQLNSFLNNKTNTTTTTTTTTTNNNQLIKFNEIEYLICKRQIETIDTKSFDRNNSILKSKLEILCPNLKNVYFKDTKSLAKYYNKYSSSSSISDEDVIPPTIQSNEIIDNTDYLIETCNGFFNYEILIIESLHSLPISNNNEMNKDYRYQFSFEFLNYYKPNTIIIQYCEVDFDYSNILINFPFINKIKFGYCINTPTNLIPLLIKSKHIKSLTIKYSSNCCNYSDRGGAYETIIKDNEKDRIDIERDNLLFKDLQFNNTLEKLIIMLGSLREQEYASNPTTLLELLVKGNNRSIRTLSLELYEIKDENHLKLLLKLPNISKLYCNSQSISAVFKHLLKNENIKKLKVDVNGDVSYTEFADLLSILLKSNNTLEELNLLIGARKIKKQQFLIFEKLILESGNKKLKLIDGLIKENK